MLHAMARAYHCTPADLCRLSPGEFALVFQCARVGAVEEREAKDRSEIDSRIQANLRQSYQLRR